MKKILCVSENGNFLMTSIASRMKDATCEVYQIAPEAEDMGLYRADLDAILLFADEEVIADQKLLVFLKDHALEDDVPIFLFGNAENIETAKKTLTDYNVKIEFHRPIDVNDALKKMEQYLKEHDRHVKKKILVIDDSGAMLRSIKEWLSEKYQVVLANSGMMGIKYMSQSLPDLILLDYEMPVADGRQVLEMIRSESDFSSVPVIFLTSKNDKESITGVLSLKPQGYLLKTLKPAEIVQAVDDFFEKQKYADKV